jgi:hypothetical protein
VCERERETHIFVVVVTIIYHTDSEKKKKKRKKKDFSFQKRFPSLLSTAHLLFSRYYFSSQKRNGKKDLTIMSQMVRRSFDASKTRSSIRRAHHHRASSFLRVFVFFNLSSPNESIFLFFSDQTKTDDARAHTHRIPSWRNGTICL